MQLHLERFAYRSDSCIIVNNFLAGKLNVALGICLKLFYERSASLGRQRVWFCFVMRCGVRIKVITFKTVLDCLQTEPCRTDVLQRILFILIVASPRRVQVQSGRRSFLRRSEVNQNLLRITDGTDCELSNFSQPPSSPPPPPPVALKQNRFSDPSRQIIQQTW